MAAINVFERYGIKEVMNVTFEALSVDRDRNGNIISQIGDIVLYLDSLTVSTVEFTAEQAEARGGWGNPKLIVWDYGKEITLTLTDALISPEFMRIMMGGSLREATATETVSIRMVKDVVQEEDGVLKKPEDLPTTYRWMNLLTGKKGQNTVPTTEIVSGETIRFWFDIEATGTNYQAAEIIISPNTFPGTYKIFGDALIRSQRTGADEAFQLVIPKAKVSSSVTLTMEAAGDPSTFDMTVTVLRDESGDMMKLIKYQIPG